MCTIGFSLSRQMKLFLSVKGRHLSRNFFLILVYVYCHIFGRAILSKNSVASFASLSPFPFAPQTIPKKMMENTQCKSLRFIGLNGYHAFCGQTWETNSMRTQRAIDAMISTNAFHRRQMMITNEDAENNSQHEINKRTHRMKPRRRHWQYCQQFWIKRWQKL